MNFEEQYLESFNDFIEQLKLIFPDENIQIILNYIAIYSNEKKIYNGLFFSSLIDNDNFLLLTNNKIKLFSHKNKITQDISESLFGTDFCLKNLLNNQPDEIKKIIWFNLQTILFNIEKTKSEDLQNASRLEILNGLINDKNNVKNNDKNNMKNHLHKMLDVDVNDETENMLNDIMCSFEGIINGQSSGANPMAGLMDISQQITTKYTDKINNGDIEIEKLMKSITKKIPGMENIMKKMNVGENGSIGDMLSGVMGKKEEKKEKVIIDSNFSTAIVDVGVIKPKSANNFKIGNILGVADNLGVIDALGIVPRGKKSKNKDMPNMMDMFKNMSGDGGMPNMADMFKNMSGDDDGKGMENITKMFEEMNTGDGDETGDGTTKKGMPNIGKMMSMLQKMSKVSSNDDAELMKEEMSVFLQNDLGINIDDLNLNKNIVNHNDDDDDDDGDDDDDVDVDDDDDVNVDDDDDDNSPVQIISPDS